MLKTNKIEEKRIRAKIKEWDKSLRAWRAWKANLWDGIKKETKIILKDMSNYMMYYKRPKKKMDRFFHEAGWCFRIVVIFFALKGFTYWLTGR